MKRSGVGVADYFAILGIGETLELKSTQKKYQRVSTSTIDENEKLQQKEAILQEEECALVERFYREIVEVCVFTAYSDGNNGDFVGGSLATSISAGCDDMSFGQQNDYYSDHESYNYDDILNKNGSSSWNQNSKRRYQISSIVPSPKKLSRKTVNNDDERNETNSPEQMLPKEISGFRIIYETISSQSRQMNHTTLGINPNVSGMSQTTDHDLSLINSSLHQNSTLDSTTQQPLDADLNPATGLLATVQSFDKIHQDVSFTNLSFETTNQTEKKEHWTRFNRGLPKTIKDQISPILATKTKAIVGDFLGNKNGDSGLCKHFYIGFRRRGADETEKPAVADLVLMYMKVNKATIVESEVSRNFEYGINSGAKEFHQENSLYDHDDENVVDVKEDPGSPRLAPKTAAVLKRGLLSGANLAKRVAVSGKNRLMRGRSKEEVVEQEKEEEESNFDYGSYEEANSDDDEEIEGDNDEGMEEILFIHEILDLPEGFENGEWIIPCAYQSIKIPHPHKMKTDSDLSSMESEEHGIPVTQAQRDEILADKRMQKTYLIKHRSSPSEGEGAGVEAFVNSETFLKPNSNIHESPVDYRRNPWSPVCEPPDISLPQELKSKLHPKNGVDASRLQSRESFMPSIISRENMALELSEHGHDNSFVYVPIVAVRRQRVGEEERFHEDPGMIDIAMTLSSLDGSYAVPDDDEYDEFETNNEEEVDEILGKSKWTASSTLNSLLKTRNVDAKQDTTLSNFPTVIFQHNLPNGFLDTPFATSVLDRFPSKDYVGAPLPEEELPMFCYVSSATMMSICHSLRY